MLKIWIDAMWAENWPEAVVSAIQASKKTHPNISFVIFGNEERLKKILGDDSDYIVVDSHDDVPMDISMENPRVLKNEHSDSSMLKWVQSLKLGDIHAFISNGNTGALTASSLLALKRLDRAMPALVVNMPQKDGSNCLFLDVWANKKQDTKTNMHNAIMAVEYLKSVKWILKPSIGYMNMWSEDNKWNDIDQETLASLKAYFSEDRVKNLEPKHILDNDVDLMLADGRAGNLILKAAEWAYWTPAKEISEISRIRKILWLVGMIKVSKTLKKYDPRPRGWAMLFGINGIVIKSHWEAYKEGIMWAINQAIEYARQQQENDILWNTKKALQDYKASLPSE